MIEEEIVERAWDALHEAEEADRVTREILGHDLTPAVVQLSQDDARELLSELELLRHGSPD